MDSGLYAAYTGLLARTQALDTAANNLANAGTNGFRAERDYFRGVLAGGFANDSQASQVGDSVNSFGILGGSRADFTQGTLTNTSNPLDLALDGQGFFAVQTQQGVSYTRDGGFSLSPTGQLQTRNGEAVLDQNQQPIELPSGKTVIAPDGTISVAGGVVGKVGVFQFASPESLTLEGANRFAAPAGMTPTAASAQVRQGALEGGNEDTVQGTMQLILVQRQAEMMQKALSVFNNDFDKTATEELGRV
jgi:flagellar basal-body rod protein FlgF